MDLSLDLFFFSFSDSRIKKFKLSFKDKIEDIKNEKMTFTIPETIFRHGKDKTAIEIILYENSNKSRNYKFNVYYGKNISYVQTDILYGYVHEIILQKMKDIQIKINEKEFKELDNLGNKDRERLTLINCGPTFITINGIDVDLLSIISDNSLEADIRFNQISILDFEKKIYIVQPIKEKSEYDIKFLEKNKEKLMTFETELKKFFDSDINNYEKIGDYLTKQFEKIKDHGSLDLNRSYHYLDEIFNTNKFLNLNLFWNYSLCIFFLDTDKKYIYFNRNAIKLFINNLKKIMEEIDEIKELPLYEKVRPIYASFMILSLRNPPLKTTKEIESLNLRYFLINENDENSIIGKCYKFYKNFVNSITEESAIFPFLLNIDSGRGYYNKEVVYAFDLKNLNMIKSHLNQVFPKIIILFYIEGGGVAGTESEFGGILMNEYYLTKLKNIDYSTSNIIAITEEEKDDISMNFFLESMHEASGHKKFALSEEENNSPIKIFNKKNEMVTLKYKYDYNPNDTKSEFILSSRKRAGDSGHYLELCYGKYNNSLIIELLRNMKNKGKLIRYPELFTNDEKKLYEYVSLREQIKENNINITFKNDTSVYDDIQQMKKELEKIKNQNNKSENKTEPISTLSNDYLSKGKRKRYNDDVDEKDDDKDSGGDNDDKKNKRKKYGPNYLKSSLNIEKEDEKNKDDNKEIQLQGDLEDYSREKRVEEAEKRVLKYFNLQWSPRIKFELKKKMKEVGVNHPLFGDLSLLLSDCYIKY